MTKKIGWQRLLEFWFKPKQLMIVESGNGRPAKNIRIRPMTILVIPLVCFLLGMSLNHNEVPSTTNNTMETRLHTLQQQFSTARNQLLTSNAEKSLKQAQIKSLKDVLEQQQESISQLQQRIQVFNSILQARKGQHVQILQAKLQSISPHSLFFHVTLVKGGNYPRHIQGHLSFIYHDAEGKIFPLHFKNGKEKLPYKMETHIFVQGEIHAAGLLPLPQHPSIDLVLYNKKGTETVRKACKFEI